MDKSLWPELKKKIAKQISSKTRSEWTKIFSGTDACNNLFYQLMNHSNDSHHLKKNFH